METHNDDVGIFEKVRLPTSEERKHREDNSGSRAYHSDNGKHSHLGRFKKRSASLFKDKVKRVQETNVKGLTNIVTPSR